MREFYVYGFKSRNDFTHISNRTYDNEKRRVESYMGNYMKWDYSKSGKKVFITMNCAQIPTNPLYSAWKSKAFTDNDIILHFYILSLLSTNEAMNIEDLTTAICEDSGLIFDSQTVRNKCKEYIDVGIIGCEKAGKSLLYRLTETNFENLVTKAPKLIEALKFFQGDTLFGEVGNFILDNNNIINNRFLFKHYYTVHTLEDGVLLDILSAIRQNQIIEFVNLNEDKTYTSIYRCIPLKIFISSTTGRRYLCCYKPKSNRFFNYRLDHIKSVKALEIWEGSIELKEKLETNIHRVWGVGFGGRSRLDVLTIKLYINEVTEQFIIERINREGRGGTLTRLEENIFLFKIELFDTNDISPWVKTFMGRIIQLEGTDEHVVNRFYNDVKKMRDLYND